MNDQIKTVNMSANSIPVNYSAVKSTNWVKRASDNWKNGLDTCMCTQCIENANTNNAMHTKKTIFPNERPNFL